MHCVCNLMSFYYSYIQHYLVFRSFSCLYQSYGSFKGVVIVDKYIQKYLMFAYNYITVCLNLLLKNAQ